MLNAKASSLQLYNLIKCVHAYRLIIHFNLKKFLYIPSPYVGYLKFASQNNFFGLISVEITKQLKH